MPLQKWGACDVEFGVLHRTHVTLWRRRTAMIKKVKAGYKVLSEKTGKNLGGPYKTKEEAEKRLRQVEFFKHRKK